MRWLIVGGLIALAGALALIAMATAIWQIVALYATLVGVGFSFSATLAGQVLAAKWFPHRVGFAVGLVLLGSNLGGIVMPPVVGWLLTRYGWRATDFMASALLLTICAPLVWLVVRLPAEGEARSSTDPSVQASVPIHADADWSYAAIVRAPAFWIIGLGFLGSSLASYAFSQNIGPYAHDLGHDAIASSLLISVLSFSGIAGRLAMGPLADRIDPRRPYWLASGLIWATLLLTLNHPGYPMLVLISVLMGLGGGGLLPVSSAMVAQAFGARSFGRVMGMVVPFFSLGAALGPLVAARIRDQSASYAAAFAPFLVVLPVAAIIMLAMPRRPRAI
jgi:MFS family permease